MPQIIEGYMPFKGYSTYYRIAGDPYSDKPPLLLLHGGPGSTHTLFELFDDLAGRDHRQLITYDQLGCGHSYVKDRPDLWTVNTWFEELCTLIDYLELDRFHLLGHSWGGMLAMHYACHCSPGSPDNTMQPRKDHVDSSHLPESGLLSLILSSAPPSSLMWKEAADSLICKLPEDMQHCLRLAQQTGCFDSDEVQAALAEYMHRFCAGPAPLNGPACLHRPIRRGREAYLTAWGPNELTPTGTLKDFDLTGHLASIRVPALILSGEHDLCTPQISRYLAEHIPHSKQHLFPGVRHLTFVEAQVQYEEVLTRWMNA